jgi:hypothetical protein
VLEANKAQSSTLLLPPSLPGQWLPWQRLPSARRLAEAREGYEQRFKEGTGENKNLKNYLKAEAKVESLYTNEPMVENNLDPIIYGQSKYTLTNTHSFLISSLTLIILLFFIKPSIILNSTQLLSLSLFYI